MTERLTAAKALEIAEAQDPSKAVEVILAMVRAAAQSGKYSIRVRDYDFGSSVCYSSERDWPETCKAIVKELRALGYTCAGRTEERQFVDLWLEVSWAKAPKEASR